MREILLLLFIFIIPVFIFLPPHLIIWVAKGLFNIDWHDKYWFVFVAWMLLGMIFESSSKKKEG